MTRKKTREKKKSRAEARCVVSVFFSLFDFYTTYKLNMNMQKKKKREETAMMNTTWNHMFPIR